MTDGRFIGEVSSQRRKGQFVVLSIDTAEPYDIEVTPDQPKVQVGDIVGGESFTNYRGFRQGVIDRVYQAESVVHLALDVVMDLHGVKESWPETIRSLDFPAQVDGGQLPSRVDIRSMPLVTIDGTDAKDFDDAVYCERISGGWRLVVAIADVAHYVSTGSALDKEALRRGNSIYLPRKVVPMLPPELSNGICSLRPHEDRLAVVCDMELDVVGEVTKVAFYEAVMQSHARLTYREVANFLESGISLGKSGEVTTSIEAFHEAFKALAQAAEKRGALDFHTVENFVDIRHGQPTSVISIARNDAHRMIELAMIAANVQASEFLAQRNVTPLYRVHDAPDRHGLQRTAKQIRPHGVAIPRQIEKPLEMQQILQTVRAKCDPSSVWEIALLAAMAQAHYAPKKIGHFGLALQSYVHFTSPIRRYPDLVVHRQIKQVLRGAQASALDTDSLSEIGKSTSATERQAIDMERQVDRWLKATLLKTKVGKTLTGVVTGVRKFGLFVELDNYYLSGLLHVSNLENEYYEFDDGELHGEYSGRIFRMGDRLQVRLTAVDAPLGRLDLKLV